VRRVYIGIDPGANGAMAAIVTNTDAPDYVYFRKTKDGPHEQAEWIRSLIDLDGMKLHEAEAFAIIEKVGAMPSIPGADGKRRQMGAATMFAFGKSAGLLEGLVIANAIPYEMTTPQTWQTAMKCKSGGDKNVTKQAAQRLFPREKITHANADALLLAEYCRRLRTGGAG
jgi:crossover junction endodeoxyribonuclease RuvC